MRPSPREAAGTFLALVLAAACSSEPEGQAIRDATGGSGAPGANPGSGGVLAGAAGAGGVAGTESGGAPGDGGSPGTSGAGGVFAAAGGASDGAGGASQGAGGAFAGAGGASGGTASGGTGAGGIAGAGGKAGAGGAPGSGGKPGAGGAPGSGGKAASGGAPGSGGAPPTDDAPPAGNPDGSCAVPAGAGAEDTSHPDRVVGTGTPGSCTGSALVKAVAAGGIITFDCGPDPVTITLTETAKVFNDKGPKIVIDGGGKVTLSGGGAHRILYMNTCDQKQVWTTSHCDNQDSPQLTVQNLTFSGGNAKGETPDGGGAIYASGGRLKVVNSRFFDNECDDTGPDVGGAAIRAFQQYDGLPLYVVHSTFGGRTDLGNVCSNGGGLSSIGVSYTVLNSVFSYNRAIGYGANPAQPPKPGGGSGGAIYNDGNTFTLTVCGTKIEHNTANEGGGAIFFVSNDRTGSLVIQNSQLVGNPSAGFETQGFPGIFVLAKAPPTVVNSTISP